MTIWKYRHCGDCFHVEIWERERFRGQAKTERFVRALRLQPSEFAKVRLGSLENLELIRDDQQVLPFAEPKEFSRIELV